MTVSAFAKINVGLRILKKRPDGFHDIETIFHRINICDELRFEESDHISLTCSDPMLPIDDSNLCIRAATILRQQFNISRGVHITLNKNIPVGAGLGGGSSDAARTLQNLCRVWKLNASSDELKSLALQLGSDVPYFLLPGTAYGTGRGEILEPLTITLPYWIVTVHPAIHISTAWAYSHAKPEQRKDAFTLKYIFTQHLTEIGKLSKQLNNDFEPIILEHHPEIGRLLDSLRFWGAELAQLSGSGSSVYGLFPKKTDAERYIRKLEGSYKTSLTPPHFNPTP